ncbi:MAG: shikimate dehydrogenase [Geminicoccaceae bacterium]
MTERRFLTGEAKLAGVMGFPIGHSRSPRLHGYWLQHYGIDGAYMPLSVMPERLEQALRALPALGFQGVNLTIPHKEAALAIVDDISEAAGRIGAVNTVIIDADGRLRGDNTDSFGFMANLEARAPDWQVASGPAVILGAGGAARAIVVGLIEAGVPEIRLSNRTSARADQLAEAIGAMDSDIRVNVLPWQSRADALDGAALLVNTTSLGMKGQPSLTIGLDGLPKAALVTDIVYAPLETELLGAARARGNPVVDGLGMLLHQGRPGFSAWFGVDPEVTERLRAAVLAD